MPLPPSLHTHISQMVFHKIRREDLVLVGKPPLRTRRTSHICCFLFPDVSHMKTTVTNDVIIL